MAPRPSRRKGSLALTHPLPWGGVGWDGRGGGGLWSPCGRSWSPGDRAPRSGMMVSLGQVRVHPNLLHIQDPGKCLAFAPPLCSGQLFPGAAATSKGCRELERGVIPPISLLGTGQGLRAFRQLSVGNSASSALTWGLDSRNLPGIQRACQCPHSCRDPLRPGRSAGGWRSPQQNLTSEESQILYSLKD